MVGATSATLSPLTRADGSASYKCPSTGFNILGSVNAPVELPARRDALKPEEATVEVLVKPGTYPGGVGERYVEGIVKGMLGQLVLGREKGFARRGVVITLAVMGGEGVGRGDSYLALLPALLNASLLALLSAAVPLSMTFAATVLAVSPSGDIIRDPSTQDANTATSLHALAISSKGHLLLNESQGRFDFDTWEKIHEKAVSICQGAQLKGGDGDVTMAEDVEGQPLQSFIRETVEDHIHGDYAWKIDAA